MKKRSLEEATVIKILKPARQMLFSLCSKPKSFFQLLTDSISFKAEILFSIIVLLQLVNIIMENY
jgi:hypothetical protein